MPRISLILIFFFSFSLIEFSAPRPSAGMKTCCCKSMSVCRCRHAGGQCPLAHSKKVSKPLTAAQKLFPLLAAAGCGSSKNDIIHTNAAKDCALEALPKDGAVFGESRFVPAPIFSFASRYPHPIERPPRGF